MTSELPESWALVRLGDVCEPVAQRGPRAESEAFRYIDLGAIDNKTKRVATAPLVPTAAAPSRAKQNVRAGDVVFSTVRVYLENIAEVPEGLDGEIASTAFCVLRPMPGVSSRYLYHYVTSRPFVLSVNSLQRGNSPPSVQDGDVRTQSFPLAPQQEQQRIASRIDELFSRIEEGERALERVQQLVERYRQSVLKAAVTGELTRDWREKNKGQLGSGEALLARVLKARREAWEKAELDKMIAKGIKPANDKWKKRYQEPAEPRTNDLPELPDGWAWTSAEVLCPPRSNALKAGPFGSSLKKSDYAKSGYKIYGQEQVIAGDWSIGDYYIGKEKFQQLESCRVQPLDVLISLVGTIGKVLVLPQECEPGIINPRLVKLSLDPNVFRSDFFKIYFESAFLKALYRLDAHGATMDVLNLGIIKGLPFPLCPLDEQAEIAFFVADAFDRIERLKGWCKVEQGRSLALRQSVLKAAFSGGLVPHGPSDEPAALLLERVSAKCGRANKNKETA